MKNKLHKFLFPQFHSDMEALRWSKNIYKETAEKLAIKPVPTMADLMRDVLSLPMLDFVNVDKDGQPPSPFEGISKEEQLKKYSILHDVYRNDVFKEVLDYLENKFGNHALRQGTEDNRRAAIFSINGIAAVRKQLHIAHDQVMEATAPPAEFDPHAVLPEDY